MEGDMRCEIKQLFDRALDSWRNSLSLLGNFSNNAQSIVKHGIEDALQDFAARWALGGEPQVTRIGVPVDFKDRAFTPALLGFRKLMG